MKAPWLSKTLWTNLVVALVAFFPGAQAWMQAHPAVMVDAFAVVNIALRLVTKQAVGLGD